MNNSDLIIASFAFVMIATAAVISLLGDTPRRTAYLVSLLVLSVVAASVFHNSRLGKALPGAVLKKGQIYEVYHHFNVEGATVVYLAPVNIRLADHTFTRNPREVPRFYTVSGPEPTNNLVIAFPEDGQAWLKPPDGTNNFRLVAE